MNKVVFYNHFGAGDIYESREFVKYWMKCFPTSSFYYAHGKDKEIIKDIPNITSIEVTEIMHSMAMFVIDKDTIYINTWIGRDGRYVLPGIGCVVEKLYEMHSDMLSVLGLGTLPNQPHDYIPKINFEYYKTDTIDKFVKDREKIVLISNGPVQSCQAENFDLNAVVSLLCDEYKDITFVVTQGVDFEKDNLFTTSDIINKGMFDLNEIAYLGKSCKLIIGRNSGPQVFCQNYDTWMDETKTIMSFTYKRIASHFVYVNTLPANKVWSPNTELQLVFSDIKEQMEKIYA